MFVMEMWDFLTLKVLIKTQNCKFFDTLVKEYPFYIGDLIVLIAKFSFKGGGYDQWVKNGDFVCLSMPEPLTVFLGLKITHLLNEHFLGHPVYHWNIHYLHV